ncbi:type VII secretion protein EccB [Kribbella sp. VKM Ac-2571]|uniref:type VII secretion protein EccB n=1 Tax=Kribbella sp. VKM Ac-2571 TaxID=2512222 RepID=UPI00105B3A80|nr:type VII secretion protein EccB [Kribbella sp. VKM Ac-2571]TDO57315.1 type VII secretion protein EccB [Kribbella sp. VKM Ac-2571]
MASKRDQLQSHQFVQQRLTHALLLRETDPEFPPFRRGIVAMLIGIGLAVLALAGAGVYGQLSPGGKTSWKSGDRVIVEKETGTRYVYRDGVLYPAANYVSALLLANKYSAPLMVSAKSLLGVPRGQRVGIPDAPDSLPAKSRLLGSGWSLCARPGVDSAGSAIVRSVLLVGTEQPGAAVDSLLVVGPDGRRYLIWRGYRHLIQQQATVAAALALNNEAWLPVPSVWLDLVPSGAPLGPISVPGAGTQSGLLRPGRIGTLYVVQTSTGQGQYYLLQRDRLLAISSLQYDVQRTAPVTREAYPGSVPEAVRLDPAVVAQVAGGVSTATTDSALPATRPTFARPESSGDSVCAVFSDGEFRPRFTLAGSLPSAGDAGVTTGRGIGGLALADAVVVQPGYGAVVEAMASPAQPAGSGALSFVSDLGRRYQLASHDVLGVLGYDQPPVVRLPAELISRLPAGHALDPDAATYPIGP